MAVYTPVQESDLRQHLKKYDIGGLVSFSGIEDGIENTNYVLTTDRGRYIFTIFERRVHVDELPFYIGFMRHLRSAGVPCPGVAMTREGQEVVSFAGKSSIITDFLEGHALDVIDTKACAAIGNMLARMHLAGQSHPVRQQNNMSLPVWRSLINACYGEADKFEDGLYSFLQDELAFLEKSQPRGLPRGVTHADMFPDNVFFKGAKISGVIDFYFSCYENLAYDLMLTFNPWCTDQAGHIDKPRAQAFFESYQAVRPLLQEEVEALSYFGRAAAMRIIATRLYDGLHPVEGALVRPKDPMEHVRILRAHKQVTGPQDYGIVLS